VLSRIAEGLLRAGILESFDWCGDLCESVTRGLTRWANESAGARHMRLLSHFGIAFTDDIDDRFETYDEGGYRDHCSLDAEAQLGGFAIFATGQYYNFPQVLVGAHIKRLEAVIGAAAWDVYGLAMHGPNCTVGCYNPVIAYEQLYEWADTESIDEEDEEAIAAAEADGQIHTVIFRRTCPEQAANPFQYSPRRLRSALRRLQVWREHGGAGVDVSWHFQVMQSAIHLLSLIQYGRRVEAIECDLGWFDRNLLKPITIRWSDEDMVERLHHDDCESTMNAGGSTDMVWLAAFDASGESDTRPKPKVKKKGYSTLPYAIKRLRYAIALLVASDHLLSLLHSPDSPDSDWPRRKRNTRSGRLINILKPVAVPTAEIEERVLCRL
jgi:hypothetical protein